MNKYDDEFVAEAVKLAEAVGVKNASNQLGVPINTLNDWVYKGVRSPGKKKKPGSYEELERSYNALVEKQKETEKKLVASERRNADLADKVEILQDCIGFFVKDRKEK